LSNSAGLADAVPAVATAITPSADAAPIPNTFIVSIPRCPRCV
jgi:hypothetical protein